MPTRRAAVLSVLAVTACGARSELLGGFGAGGGVGAGASSSSSASASSSTASVGATGSGGTGSTGVTTGSGAGGSFPRCDGLLASGPPIGTESVPGPYHERRPSLVDIGGGNVAVVFGLDIFESPVVTPPKVAHAGFPAWFEWPADLGAAHVAADDGGYDFRAGTSDVDGYALLVAMHSVPPSGDVFLAPSVEPFFDYAPLPDGALVDVVLPPNAPVFVTRGPGRYLAGTAYTTSVPIHQLELTVVEPGPLATDRLITSGCGNGSAPVVAAGAPTGSAFVFALSSSVGFGQCVGAIAPGAPNRLQTGTWQLGADGAGVWSFGTEILGVDPIRQIEIAPRSDGAWMVWQEDGASSEVPPPIHAVRLDAQGALASSILDVSPDAVTSGPFAAAALGDELVVAWPEATDPSSPTITLRVLDPNGAPDGGATQALGPEWLDFERIHLVGRGQQVLLAWSSSTPDAGVGRVRVARFDCAGPE